MFQLYVEELQLYVDGLLFYVDKLLIYVGELLIYVGELLIYVGELLIFVDELLIYVDELGLYIYNKMQNTMMENTKSSRLFMLISVAEIRNYCSLNLHSVMLHIELVYHMCLGM